jgi:hypothetical protein
MIEQISTSSVPHTFWNSVGLRVPNKRSCWGDSRRNKFIFVTPNIHWDVSDSNFGGVQQLWKRLYILRSLAHFTHLNSNNFTYIHFHVLKSGSKCSLLQCQSCSNELYFAQNSINIPFWHRICNTLKIAFLESCIAWPPHSNACRSGRCIKWL